MFYVDGISLNKITEEFKEQLTGKKVSKIIQTSSLAISINFGKLNLVLSCSPNLSIGYLSDKKEDNFMEETTNFSLTLKKCLVGSLLMHVEQTGYDRIIVFTFSKLNELGELKVNKLYVEFMGKHSNLILTDSQNKIVELLKRFSIEENALRFLFPGAEYIHPVLEKKKNPNELTKTEFETYKSENSLLQNVEGIGKTLSSNLSSYEKFKEILNSKITPKIFTKNNEPILATVLDIQPNSFDSEMTFPTYSEMVNYYLEIKNLSNSFKLLNDKLNNTINREIKKIEKTIKNLTIEIEDRKDFDRYREIGDILAASLYLIKKGMNSIELYDFYKDEMCKIDLDPLLTPERNLEKIYKKYNKLKKGLEFSKKRLEEFNEALKYFNGVKLFITKSSNVNNLKLIEEELQSQGYFKESKKISKKKKVVKELSYETTNIDGYTVLYGRNNLENDNLTMKIAEREDYWFHAKDIPGSHLILKSSVLPEESTILKIAELAAKMSKATPGDKVTIDYTKKKYLNKPKGAKPGFVTYSNSNSIIALVK